VGRKRVDRVALLVSAAVALSFAFVLSAGFVLRSGPRFPPNGITVEHASPIVYFKLCPGRTIGRLVLGEIRPHTQDYNAPTVWTATLTNKATGRIALLIRPAIVGYHITSALPLGRLDPNSRYAVTDARDENGVNILGSVSDFRTHDLRPGVLLDNNGNRHDLNEWLSQRGARCR
jgi:hypothetical protein